jgi:hypothetical protein
MSLPDQRKTRKGQDEAASKKKWDASAPSVLRLAFLDRGW